MNMNPDEVEELRQMAVEACEVEIKRDYQHHGHRLRRRHRKHPVLHWDPVSGGLILFFGGLALAFAVCFIIDRLSRTKSDDSGNPSPAARHAPFRN